MFHLAKSTRDPRHCRKALAKSDLGGGKLQLQFKELFIRLSRISLNTLQMAKSFIWKSIKIMTESSPVVEGVFGIFSSHNSCHHSLTDTISLKPFTSQSPSPPPKLSEIFNNT
jgi:hypothetical protein